MRSVLAYGDGCDLDDFHFQLALPVISIAFLTYVSAIAQVAHLVEKPYLSPYVALVALLANRAGVRAGLFAALLSMLTFNFLFEGSLSFKRPSLPEASAYIAMIAVALLVARKTTFMAKPEKSVDKGQPLPFTRGRTAEEGNGGLGLPMRFWAVPKGGEWHADCEVGREYGHLYVERLRGKVAVPLLSWIVADMIESGSYSGIEAGFLSVVGQALDQGRVKARESQRPQS